MRLHGVKMHNIFRYGDKDNVVEFDKGAAYFLNLPDKLPQWQKEERATRAKAYLEKYLGDDTRRVISIIGMINGNPLDSNGSGKSSIAEAILYVLYEKINREFANDPEAKRKSTLSVVMETDGIYKTEAYGSILMTADGALWHVKRGRKVSNNSDHTAIFHIECLASMQKGEEGSHSGQRKSADQETLNQLVKYSYDTMCNSTMFGQKDTGKVFSGGDKEYKQVVLNALQAGVLNDYLKEGNERRKEVSRSISMLESQLEILKSDANQDVVMMSSRLEELRTGVSQLDSIIESFRSKLDGAESQTVFDAEQAAKQAYSEAQLVLNAKHSQEIVRLNGLNSNLDLVQKAISGLEREIKSLENKTKMLDMDIARETTTISGTDIEKAKKDQETATKAGQMKSVRSTQRDDTVRSIHNIDSEIAVLKSDLTKAEKEARSFENKLNAAQASGSGLTCPECETVVSSDHINTKLSEKKTRIEEINKKISDLIASKEPLVKELSVIEGKLKLIDEWIAKSAGISRAIANYQAAIERNETYAKEMAATSARIIEANKELEKQIESRTEIQASISVINSDMDSILKPFKDALEKAQKEASAAEVAADKVRREAASIKATIKEKETARSTLTYTMGTVVAQMDKVKKAKEQYASIKEQLAEKTTREARLRAAEKEMGPDGFQADLLHKYLPMLNSDINEYMGVITDYKRSAKLQWNTVKDEFELVILSGEASSKPNLISGGEGVGVRLALDIGLSLLCFARATEVPEFIFLDEVLSALDKKTTDRVFNMIINKLHQHFKMIVVISHDMAVQEKIKNTIVVNKVNGVSTIYKQWFEDKKIDVPKELDSSS